jgi:hypothetical protein
VIVATEIARVTLEGLPETVRKLAELPKRIEKRCMTKAVRAGAAPLVKAAKAAAPRLTGLFKRSLDSKVKSYAQGRVTVAIVGQKKQVTQRKKLRRGRGGISGRRDLVPVHFVEEDTRPHRIPKEGRGPLTLRLPSGQTVTVSSIQHPGTRGQHPLRRAADAASGVAAQQFTEKLRVEVDREVEALRSV